MFISKKNLALLVIAASGAQGYHVQSPPKTSRRAMLQKAGTTGAAFLAVASGMVNPDPSFAMDTNMNRMDTRDVAMNRSVQQNSPQKNFLDQGTNSMSDRSMAKMSLAKVSEWPESQYLVPFSEMEQSLDVLKKQVNMGQVPTAKRMADNFVAQNTNAYKMAAKNYAKSISYANPTDTRARQDEQFFLDAADQTVAAMKEVQGKLRQLSMKGDIKENADVLASINRAQDGVQRILNVAPRDDLQTARNYARSVASTKTNKWLEGDQAKVLATNGQSTNYGANNMNFARNGAMKDAGRNLAYNAGYNTEGSFDKNFKKQIADDKTLAYNTGVDSSNGYGNKYEKYGDADYKF